MLKPDAKIMLVANDGDGRWINGDVGVITDIHASQSQAAITVALENGYAGTIAPYTWEVVRYTYDAPHDRIEAEVVGSFTQGSCWIPGSYTLCTGLKHLILNGFFQRCHIGRDLR